ncbi:hypothetical protein MKO06_05930 [Gramella sp. GC03-9]|uniref:Uncharacterized protein n=1 Tax=Christiangramia oceanisediminis TaxID=2920386 RepID=A0A9X2I1V1_9FLAO|nr:hypothetical protein [Gramella oceanisediminis]MCP9199436.1 hypothetical protein [Gramella oceanisediminis]
MITKNSLIKQIEHLPESFSIDELIERLVLIEKVEIGERQSDNAEIISEIELNKEMEKWFK